jgi:hypothetical protein
MSRRRNCLAVLAALALVALLGCAGYEGGYATSGEWRVGVDYYDPWFGDYGGWGPGDRVGPPRGRTILQPDYVQGHRLPRGYRPAPRAQPVPDIPQRPRTRGPRPKR